MSWLWGTTLRRWRAQWRLLSAVLAVTLLACTLVTALGLLATTTEQNGVSSALSALPEAQSRIDLTLLDPTETIAETREQVESTLTGVLGASAKLDTTVYAISSFVDTDRESINPPAAYFGEFDGFESFAQLVDGHWADATTPLSIAVPESAATAFGLRVGDALSVDGVDVTVAGIYSPIDQTDPFWNGDPLGGNGDDPAFPRPGIMDFEPIHAFGPLVVGQGGLAAADVRASKLEIAVDPDLGATTVAELEPLTEQLDDLDFEIRQRLADSSASLFVESNLSEGVRSVAVGLIVTRSTVIVVSLLLLVLAVAAIGQTARLLADARATDRQLMRSRGASTGHVLSIAVVEAVALGVVTALVSPLLAGLVYRAFAATPAAVAAGIPAWAEFTAFTWLSAAVTALIFVVVLIAPLLARGSATSDALKSRGRQKVARTGLDIALIVVAGVAYAQLQAYKTPVDTDSSLTIDPILVAGPAIVLLAAAFACVRFLPLVARLFGHFGSRARGIVLPLAAWEIGRRPQRAATAVLLLSLALAVGTFGLSFLATWQKSQVDQAALAIGAPARVLTEVEGASPVLRVSGRLGGSVGDVGVEFGGSARSVQVIGLAPGARGLIDRGRLSELGGEVINSRLDKAASVSKGIDIPGSVTEITANVTIGDDTVPPIGVTANLQAVVEDSSGILQTLYWGEVPVDGNPHAIKSKSTLTDVRLVGVTATFTLGLGLERAFNVTTVIDDLEVVGESKQSEPLAGDSAGWFVVGELAPPSQAEAPSEGQIEFTAILPGDYSTVPSVTAFVGWEPTPYVRAVIPTEIAKEENLTPPQKVVLLAGGAVIDIEIAGDAELVPGSAPFALVQAGGVGALSSIVVDHTLFERALVESGSARSFVDEWWVDVPEGGGAAFVRDNPGAVSTELLARSLQESPLRIATPIALWLTIIAGALLATIGFVMHTSAGLRSRRLELAQLAAIGVARPKLLALVTIESFITGLLGAVIGAAIGILLALLVGPLVALSPDGNPPVPSVEVQLPVLQFLLLDVGLVVVLAVVVLVVGRARSFAQPAELLRWAGE